MGIKMDPGYVRIGQMTLVKLITTAYGVGRDQLVGPDWLLEPDGSTGAFDIDAKLPTGSTASQVPLMLQSLLEERFKLTVRKGSRESEGYTLVVGKGGPRFSSKKASGAPGSSRDDSLTVSEGKAPGEFTIRQGASTETTIPGRLIRLETSTIGGLVDFLKRRSDLPVIDKTGLSGDFDIRMDVSLVRIDSAAIDGSDAPPLAATVAAATEAVRAACFAAVKTLGLELKLQKFSRETIIVEHIEKAPTEN